MIMILYIYVKPLRNEDGSKDDSSVKNIIYCLVYLF